MKAASTGVLVLKGVHPHSHLQHQRAKADTEVGEGRRGREKNAMFQAQPRSGLGCGSG